VGLFRLNILLITAGSIDAFSETYGKSYTGFMTAASEVSQMVLSCVAPGILGDADNPRP